MRKIKEKIQRQLTFGEETANVITHGLTALGVLVMMPFCYIACYDRVLQGTGRTVDLIGLAIFLICIFFTFFMSAIYHVMPHDSKHKAVLKVLDHCCIYFAIAGSYTPIALSVLMPQPKWGLAAALGVLILQWGTVIFGVLYKSLAKKKNSKVSLAIYLVMGWTVVLVFPLFWGSATPGLFWFILAGGIFYSVGSVFYAVKKMKYQHMIWHLFVTAGAVCHLIGLSFFLH